MKNENKCFFSISLENGITITSENPDSVKNFLSDLSLICNDALKRKKNPTGWDEYVNKLKKCFDKGWTTIYNNLYK